MIKDDGSAVVGNYEPRINQMHITPKEELVNPNIVVLLISTK